MGVPAAATWTLCKDGVAEGGWGLWVPAGLALRRGAHRATSYSL